MPPYQDHLIFGSFLAATFAYLFGSYLSFSLEAVLVSTSIILLASVFPDVDHRNSVVHRRVKALSILLVGAIPLSLGYPDPVVMLGGAALAGTGTYLLFELVKPRHRAITHTFLACAVFSSLAGLSSLIFFDTFLPAVFAFVSYYSHLVLDRTLSFS